MRHPFAAACAATTLFITATPTLCRAAVGVEPTDPPSLKVIVSPGEIVFPDGTSVEVSPATLPLDPPQTVERTAELPIPGNYAPSWDNWRPWSGKWKDAILAVGLSPRRDGDGTLILGNLFRQIPAESLTLTTLDGSTTFTRGEDYRYSRDWAQIGNLSSRLGTPGVYEGGKAPPAALRAEYEIVLQRLDLVQVGPGGMASIKKGVSHIVCPQLPAPDPGHVAVAGVYIAPWTLAMNPMLADSDGPAPGVNETLPDIHGVTRHEILPIDPAPPVERVNPQAVSKTLSQLVNGEEVRIAFMGDSITLGAEAGPWWDGLWTDENLAYPSRVVVGLRTRFPAATITPIAAFKGGVTTAFGLEVMKRDVLPKKPDLVIIAFGANDAAGPMNGGPKNAPQHFKEDLRKLIRAAREGGAEVMLIIQMPTFAWHPPARRWSEYCNVQFELAEEEGVALADVNSQWMNQATRGTPPWSQLHNWLNHPGIEGHALFADVVLRFFPGG